MPSGEGSGMCWWHSFRNTFYSYSHGSTLTQISVYRYIVWIEYFHCTNLIFQKLSTSTRLGSISIWFVENFDTNLFTVSSVHNRFHSKWFSAPFSWFFTFRYNVLWNPFIGFPFGKFENCKWIWYFLNRFWTAKFRKLTHSKSIYRFHRWTSISMDVEVVFYE